MVENPSNGLILRPTLAVGVVDAEALGGFCGVVGGSILLAFAITEAPSARVLELSRRLLGASLILGCV